MSTESAVRPTETTLKIREKKELKDSTLFLGLYLNSLISDGSDLTSKFTQTQRVLN